jgi:hypothetical protein
MKKALFALRMDIAEMTDVVAFPLWKRGEP